MATDYGLTMVDEEAWKEKEREVTHRGNDKRIGPDNPHIDPFSGKNITCLCSDVFDVGLHAVGLRKTLVSLSKQP